MDFQQSQLKLFISLNNLVGAGELPQSGEVLAVGPVDDRHLVAGGDVGDGPQPISCPPTVDPGLGELPGGGYDEHIAPGNGTVNRLKG